jgi:hypothetical protein
VGLPSPQGAEHVPHLWPDAGAKVEIIALSQGRGWTATALSPAVAGRVRGHSLGEHRSGRLGPSCSLETSNASSFWTDRLPGERIRQPTGGVFPFHEARNLVQLTNSG